MTQMWCENCGLAYDVLINFGGEPDTQKPFTCDDCGGYVGPEVKPPKEPAVTVHIQESAE